MEPTLWWQHMPCRSDRLPLITTTAVRIYRARRLRDELTDAEAVVWAAVRRRQVGCRIRRREIGGTLGPQAFAASSRLPAWSRIVSAAGSDSSNTLRPDS